MATIRVALAAADLFFPQKSGAGRKKIVKKFLSGIRSGSAKELFDRAPGHAIGGGFIEWDPLKPRFFATKAALKQKDLILHELTHFFKPVKNHLLAANALGGYVYCLPRRMVRRGINSYAWLQDAEEIAKINFSGTTQPSEHDLNAHLGHAKTSIAQIGIMLGFIAAKKERYWKKPASDLFLIREISNGVPVKKAVKKIESGQLDTEISAFAKRHLKNLLDTEISFFTKMDFKDLVEAEKR